MGLFELICCVRVDLGGCECFVGGFELCGFWAVIAGWVCFKPGWMLMISLMVLV